MADVYLHLGAHKTGTKHLQHWLAGNSEFLRSQDSVFIRGRRVKPDTRRWRWEPTRDEVPASLTHLFGRLTNRPERSCVFSWEGMLGVMDLKQARTIYPGARVVLEVLHDLLGENDAKIAFTVREYGSWVESGYKWLVRHTKSATFKGYMSGVDLDALSWVPAVTAMRDIFGEERVLVRSYEAYRRNSEAGDKELIRFLYGPAVDLSLLKEPTDAERNVSPNAKGLEFARLTHHLLRKSAVFDQADVDRLDPLIRRFVTENFNRENDPEPPVLLDPAAKERLSRRYVEDCRELGIEL